MARSDISVIDPKAARRPVDLATVARGARAAAADEPTRDGHFHAWAYFGLTAVGLIYAALCGAGLSWDSSGLLFESLDKQTPLIPNGRLIAFPLQLPVLLASHVTDNLVVLQTIFGLSYLAVPLIALATAWWIVRDTARPLFVWAALGIGLVMLPGQFNVTEEANIALQLFWPVLLALLTGMRRVHVPLVLALALAILFSHPYAIGLFAVTSVVAVAMGLRGADQSRRLRWWALGFAALAALALFRFLQSTYDTQQVSQGGLLWSLTVSTVGLPLVALSGALLAAAALFAAPFARQRGRQRLARALRAIEVVGIVAVAVSLVLWARDPHLWRWANKFDYPALFASLYVMGLAVVEGLVHARETLRGVDLAVKLDWRRRAKTIQAIALVFSIVLCVQGAAWFSLTGRLRDTLDQSAWSCVSMASLGWLQSTPLNEFATPDRSILLQGRTPQKVVLSGNGCGDTTFSGGVSLNQYYLRGWQTGWFNLQPLRQRLLAEQDTPHGCSFMLITGWQTTETDGPYWWRWSDGRDALIRVLLDRATTVVMNGQLGSIRYPNQLAVSVNGAPPTTLDVSRTGLQPLQPLSFTLRQGANVIQFVSRNPAIAVGGLPLAIEMANVTMVSRDNSLECALHP